MFWCRSLCWLCWASWIDNVFYLIWDIFSNLFFSNIFSAHLFLFFWKSHDMFVGTLYIVPQICEVVYIFFTPFFLSVLQTGYFLLIYLQVHSFCLISFQVSSEFLISVIILFNFRFSIFKNSFYFLIEVFSPESLSLYFNWIFKIWFLLVLWMFIIQ